jgi:arylsulfatase A-like enzyme
VDLTRRQFLGAVAATQFTVANTRPPNIIFILADDVGYGDLSCYGATSIRTPNLDKLAGGGLRLTNGHATSATCTPSRYSLMTGEYAWRRKDTAILPGDAPALIAPGRTTLPSILKQSGYATGCVGKWHLGLGNGNVDWNGEIQPGPNQIGFDYSFIIPATGDRVPCVFVENGRVANLDPADPIKVSYKEPFPGELVGRDHPELLRMKPSHGHNDAIVNGVGRIGYMTGGKKALWVDEEISTVLTGKALTFIDDHAREPFFLYFATHDIHVPRVPNPRFVGKSSMGARGDAILELDWTVGEVLKTLERRGLTKNTLLMFSSDNGPVVNDGYRDQAVERLGSHKPAGVYRGGKYSNFDGGTRVPWIVRWPGRVKPDQTSDAAISQVDLPATLAALAGQQLADRAAPDSLNELAALLGESKTGRPYVVEQAGALSIVQDGWKLISPSDLPKMDLNTNTELGNDPQPQLYHVRDDPAEKHDRAAQEPERVRMLSGLLNKVQNGRDRF